MLDKQKVSKKNIYRTIGYLLIFLLFAFLFKNTNFKEIIYQIKKIDKLPLFILLLMQVITQLLLAFQWFGISQVVLGKSDFFKILHILTIGSVIEAITPGAKIGGEATRIYYLKRDLNCSTITSANIVIIQKSISMSVLFIICIIAFNYLSVTFEALFSPFTKFLVLFFGMISILFMFALLFFTKSLLKLLSKCNFKFANKLRNWVESYSTAVSMLSTPQWILQFLISFAVWILFPIKMYVLTKTFALDLNFFVILAITMTSYMLGMLPLTPGGIGTFEGGMISLFSMISTSNLVDLSIFVTITIVFRFVTFWFVIIISLIYVLIWTRFKKENL